MHDALPRIPKSERKVLALLTASSIPTHSTRRLAAALDLSRSTVQSALRAVNDLSLVRTHTGSGGTTSTHEVERSR